MPLRPDQRAAVRAALGKGDPSALAEAAELHQFVLHYPWADGVAALARVLEHPACDLGTALAIFWLAEPEYPFSRYGSLERALAAEDPNRETFRLLESLLARLERDGWSNRTISSAPPPGPHDALIRALPEPLARLVTTPSPGREHPLEALDSVAYLPLTAADRAAIEKKLSAARAALVKLGAAPEDARPEAIVQAIQRVTDEATAGRIAPTRPALQAMGFLLCEQLHLELGAVWMVRVANGKREPYLCSLDRAIVVSAQRLGPALVEHYAHVRAAGLFAAMGKVVAHGADFGTVLSPEESAHLFRYRDAPHSWPVWGVYFKLAPWP